MRNEMTLERRGMLEAAAALVFSQLLILGERAPLSIAGPLVPGMLPLLVFSIRWGLGPGWLVCLASGLLRLLTRRSLYVDWWSYFLEQTVSFALLGIAGLFRGRKNGVLPAIVLSLCPRYWLLFTVSCRYHAQSVPATFMYITLTSPRLYFAVYHGVALCMNLCLCMAICTPLLYPLRRFFRGADLWEPATAETEERAEAFGEVEPSGEEPALFLFKDRYTAVPARPSVAAQARREEQPPETRTEAQAKARQPATEHVPSAAKSAALDRAEMRSRSMPTPPAQPKKPNPYQRKERYNPYEWYEKRDRSLSSRR